jgi:hypothetical protein
MHKNFARMLFRQAELLSVVLERNLRPRLNQDFNFGNFF